MNSNNCLNFIRNNLTPKTTKVSLNLNRKFKVIISKDPWDKLSQNKLQPYRIKVYS